jgi:VanZ family protein
MFRKEDARMKISPLPNGRVSPLRPLFAIGFVVALVFAVTMALLPHPPRVVGNMWDKEQHMLAFGTLTFLACFGFPRATLFRIAERLSFVGALIEVAQSYPPLHRDCDIFDWVADTTAVVGMVLIVGFLSWIRERLRKPQD